MDALRNLEIVFQFGGILDFSGFRGLWKGLSSMSRVIEACKTPGVRDTPRRRVVILRSGVTVIFVETVDKGGR